MSNDISNLKIRDTSREFLSRQKRWLVWKEGVNWVSVIFGIGIPVEVQYQSITLGMVLKAYYQLPNNSSYYTNPTIDYERKKRSPTRWMIYEMIEKYLEKNKYGDGKACLLKAICELAAVPLEERSGLLAEIVHSILTPSSTDDAIEENDNNIYHAAEKLGKTERNCDQLFPECATGLIQQFSRFMDVSKYMY
ncbi:hypothetical protein GWI33_005636 [Rhynchophorus ferrugineus]|uniref:Uncharacterized protein n=1 Tax=Rhynchophorus ferrugineus TaxID=354439 RepID=A0A834IH52_RHYFE|nr:hypothetical protein GWI33_005636 [Rhynchophorus ferrugineus]